LPFLYPGCTKTLQILTKKMDLLQKKQVFVCYADTEREREREFGIVCTWHTLPRFQQKEKKKQQREFSIVNNICLSNYLFVAPVTNTSWGTSIYLDQIERDRGLYSEQKKNETRYYTASF
jgi:hypothetical protein